MQQEEEETNIFDTKIQFNEFEINLISHKVEIKSKEVILTNLEFNLLFYLASQPGTIIKVTTISPV